jgi:rhamnulokinase
MGIETRKPLINKETEAMNFTNEGGVEGTFRFLKNITGLWLLEQCRKEWARENLSYEQLMNMAKAENPFQYFVDTDASDFMNPANMVETISQYCRRTGQNAPETAGQFVRCIFESLAMKYRNTVEALKKISPHPIEKLYVIGGGSKNAYLCQLTANAIGMPVVAGPAEGAAIGNLLVQAMALGHLDSLADIRKVVRNSVETKTYLPHDVAEWEHAYEKFKIILP